MSQEQLWDAGPIQHKRKRGRPRQCSCGTCTRCKRRIYMLDYMRDRKVGVLRNRKPPTRGKPTLKGNGYMYLRLPADDPFAAMATGKDRYVQEHRLVMAEHLGRQLDPSEAVHHINGDRKDNRIENLELWTHSHPSGQRVLDKVQWAHEILEKYSDEAPFLRRSEV